MAKRKPLKQRVNKDLQICGRKFQIAWGKGNIGGQFHTIHPKTGGGLIVLGDAPKDEYYQLNNLVHEILEVVYTLRNVRYYESEDKIVFTMTHDQFQETCLDITRALVESGVVEVTEVGDVKP